MKLKYKFMLDKNPNNLNKIKYDELTWEIVSYALQKGFNYKNAIDNRYELLFPEYVIYNINHFDEYLEQYILNANASFLKEERIKNLLVEKITSHPELLQKEEIKQKFTSLINLNMLIDVNLLIKIVELTGDISFINNIKNKDISVFSKEEIQLLNELFVKKFEYKSIPKWFASNNLELGISYLKKDINNIVPFLNNNQNSYNSDEILNIICDNIREIDNQKFQLFLLFLNANKNTVGNLAKIYNTFSFNFDYLSIIYQKINNKYFFENEIANDIRNNKIIITKANINNNNLELLSKLIVRDGINIMENAINNSYIFDYIELLVNNDKYVDWKELINLLVKNNIYLTSDSPDYLKTNIDYAIISLKNHSISLKDLKASYYLDAPVDKILELVDVGLLNKEEKKLIDEYKQLINERLNDKLGTNKNHYYLNPNEVLNDDYYSYIIANIPDEITTLYLVSDNSYKEIGDKAYTDDNSLANFDITKINKIIDAIKSSNKNIKLAFSLGYEEINSDLIEQITDKSYVNFYSINLNTTLSCEHVILLNKTLELFVEDIKNSSLSPYEKYIAVYNIVKSFKTYKLPKDDDELLNRYDQSRNIYLILENDFMVCVGYANMLKTLLNKVGISSISYAWNEGEHQLNYVEIKDPKYNISGLFKSDPTADNAFGIDDPINKGYNSINMDITMEHDTPLDRFLNSDDDYVQKLPAYEINQLYYYLVELDKDLKNISDKKEALIRFRNKFKNQKTKQINPECTVDSIISIKELIQGNPFSEEERESERKDLICRSFGELKKTLDISKDLEMIDLSKYTLRNFRQQKSIFQKYLISELIKNKINNLKERISNMDNSIIVDFSLNDGLSLEFSDLNEQQIDALNAYFESIGNHSFKIYEYDGQAYAYATVTNILDKELDDDFDELVIKTVDDIINLKISYQIFESIDL